MGNRVRADASRWSLFLRGLAARFFRRWGKNVLRVRSTTSDVPIGISELGVICSICSSGSRWPSCSPEELAPTWSAVLERWRAAHQGVLQEPTLRVADDEVVVET